MSVKVRQRIYRETNTATWQADIHVKLLDGRKIRERSKVPGATSRSVALKWAHERERWLIVHGHETPTAPAPPVVPTFAEFSRRFLAEYAVANRLKPSTIHNQSTLLRNYLAPHLGDRPLDQLREPDVQRLKAALHSLAPATVNNALTLLSTMLKTAAEWCLIATPPRIRMLKEPPPAFSFYDDDTFERLVTAATSIDPICLLVVLLGGEAGLRAGEILALRLRHCDLRRGVLRIEENEWQGHIGTPKGHRARQVVMTARLRATLLEFDTKHPGPDRRLIARLDGTPATKRVIDGWLHRAQRAAGLPIRGPHVLRHTFCSRLAASGAAPRAIQELAGHRHSTTTDRYLHLTPCALQTAIGLLDARPPVHPST